MVLFMIVWLSLSVFVLGLVCSFAALCICVFWCQETATTSVHRKVRKYEVGWWRLGLGPGGRPAVVEAEMTGDAKSDELDGVARSRLDLLIRCG